MAKYQKKPVIIEAVQFNYDKAGLTFEGFPVYRDMNGFYITIKTLEGNMRCSEKDWIITGIKGEKYPCKPDIFEATYEAVSNGEKK